MNDDMNNDKLASTRPVRFAIAYLRWNGDGTYTPVCEACRWKGTPRDIHSIGEAAVRSHTRSRRHRKALNKRKDVTK